MTNNPTVNAIVQLNNEDDISSNPYLMFKYSTRAEVTRKYYERRIRHFFDLIGFDLESKTDLQKRCNNFAYKGRSEIKWATEQIIKFLQFQKDTFVEYIFCLYHQIEV